MQPLARTLHRTQSAASLHALKAGKLQAREGKEAVHLHLSPSNILHLHFHNFSHRDHSRNNPWKNSEGPVLAPWPGTLPCSGQADAFHDYSPGFVRPFLIVSPWPCDNETQLDLAKQAKAPASDSQNGSCHPHDRQSHGSLTYQVASQEGAQEAEGPHCQPIHGTPCLCLPNGKRELSAGQKGEF